jgi:hypothetical protein
MILLGAAAPMASASNRHNDTAAYVLGGATAVLFATGHRDAGYVGLGLTALAAAHDIDFRTRDCDRYDVRWRDHDHFDRGRDHWRR